MAADEKWYFTKEQLAITPSRKCGYDADKELSCRQQAANFIQDMGQRLQVSQLCINTAIVYMHRFYVFHSFSHFHRHAMAAAALFLAAKVEEQPRKLEHVIKVTQICLHRDQAPLDVKSEQYLEQAQDLVFNENVLLQTLGFDVAIDHPHTHVVRCCHLVRASKDLAQTSYFMASNSLHLTTMCLQYKPTVVACFCIHLACKWSNWEIPQSNEGKYWFYYVDRSVTQELLEQLTAEFLVIFDKCPSRLKRKIMSANQNSSNAPATYQFDKMPSRDSTHEGVSFQSHQKPQDPSKPSSSLMMQPSSSSQRTDEKREHERPVPGQPSAPQHRDGHHRSHHPHQHLSSAAALLKPHAGVPPHGSKPQHPMQPHHRPSMSQHPRPDQQSRPRPDHPSRPEHHRPEHQLRPDHQQRPDQGREHQQERPEHQNRPEHMNRPQHTSRDRLHHAEQSHSGVTAARDQLRREAALQREASRRDPILHLPTNIMNHSPAQRTVSGDSAISVGSSGSSTTPSSQDWTNFGTSTVPGSTAHSSSTSGQKHSSHSEHRHSLGHDSKSKSNNPTVDPYARHRSSLPGSDRRPANSNNNSAPGNSSNIRSLTVSCSISNNSSLKDVSSGKQPSVPFNNQQLPSSRHRRPHENLLNIPPREDALSPSLSSPSLSLDKKMQEITERRQLESFFGKTEVLDRLGEKHQHQPKQLPVPCKEVKKEFDSPQAVPQLDKQHIINQIAPPFKEVKKEFDSPQVSSQHMLQRTFNTSQAQVLVKRERSPPLNPIKPDIAPFPMGRVIREKSPPRATPPLPAPKVEKIESDMKGDPPTTTKLPPVKSSIFSPEKTPLKEREQLQARPTKLVCPPSPGIAFGSPPVTPGKVQGSSSNRVRTASSCSEADPVLELTKIDREPGFENVIRDGRVDMRNSATAESQVPSYKVTDARVMPQTPKVDTRQLPATPLKLVTPPDLKSSMQPTTVPAVSVGKSSSDISDDRLISKPSVSKPLTSSRVTDSQQTVGTPVLSVSEGREGAVTIAPEEALSGDHHHHKSKKKKEKKEKHKHKDKDKEKHREEKKHKSKHKEKDKERRKSEACPTELSQSSNQSLPAIKLTIPRVNITPPPAPPPVEASSGGLKLKINLSQLPSASTLSSASKESRKRDRDRSSPGSEPSTPKVPKIGATETPKRGGSSSSGSYSRQNGLESRGAGRHHGQQQQHYTGSKVTSGGSISKPSEMSKGSSSHSTS